jgi:Adenylate and Guanylate cyclase catalytic domain
VQCDDVPTHFAVLDVAVCGLPEPNPKHAVVMARFATACRETFNLLMAELATQLGPDTRDLMLRIGLHSGPVTAGVLRGQKSRFQLFGDTVNTASRMESNGLPSKIQASPDTAKLLIDAGKTHWIKPRETPVQAKGKGTVQTYWVEPTVRKQEIASISGHIETKTDETALIDWTADTLVSLTKQVLARRQPLKVAEVLSITKENKSVETVIDEFEDVIEMSHYGSERCSNLPISMKLSERLRKEIYMFVKAISQRYRGKSCPERRFAILCYKLNSGFC